MDFDSILREMEKERQKAFEIKKKESSKDKEKHENVQEEDEERRDDTSKEDEEERTEDEDSEHEETEEEKEEHEETAEEKEEESDEHVESEEQGESEEKDNEDDEVKEESSEEAEGKEDDEEKEDKEEVKEENSEEVEENKEEVVKEETETKVETLENVTEKAKTSKTPQPSVSSVKLKIKPKLQSIKLNSTQTKSIIKQKDVIKMPKKINVPKKTKIIKTTKIKRIITQPATSVKKIKVTAIGASAPAEIKRLAKDVARLKEVLDKLLKEQKENYTISLRKQKEKEIETIRKNKEKEIEAIKRDKEKEANALKRHAELKNELNKSAKKEDVTKESQIFVSEVKNEIDKVRKDIAYLKEFQPEILFNSIQKLNENITEMNSLFRLAAELMQKPDPVQSKLKKLFDENEKIAQGILTVLDAVNEIKQFGTREVEDIRRIEEEIRLPLKEIASRKQTDDMEAPSIPAPPPEFRETSANEDSFSFGSSNISGISKEMNEKNKALFGTEDEIKDAGLPLPPEMTPIPTSTGAPIPPESFQSFGQQAQSSAMRPAQPSQFGSTRALQTSKSSTGAFPNELPPSPTEFTQEQLDQLASMVPPLPRPSMSQFPPQRMQQTFQTQSSTQFQPQSQARQPQQPQQRPARFVRKKEELKM